MKTIKFKLEKEQYHHIFHSRFLERLKENNIQVKVRLDQFSELEVQPFHYYSLSSDLIIGKSLKEVEEILESIQFIEQPIVYPKAVGLIPYEQATEFLPIALKGDVDEQICIIPSALLAISTDKTTAYLIRTREDAMPEMTLDTYHKIITTVCHQMADEKEGLKGEQTLPSKGYQIAEGITQNKTDDAYRK